MSNLAWAAEESNAQDVTVPFWDTERNKYPEDSRMFNSPQILKYNSIPQTGQTILFEPLLKAKTLASPDRKVFVHTWLNKSPELSGKRKIDGVEIPNRSAARSAEKKHNLKEGLISG